MSQGKYDYGCIRGQKQQKPNFREILTSYDFSFSGFQEILLINRHRLPLNKERMATVADTNLRNGRLSDVAIKN